MKIKNFSQLFLITFSIITLLAVFPLFAYAAPCAPGTGQYTNPDTCKTSVPCQVDCQQVPGQPGLYCCPKGCVGASCPPGSVCIPNPLKVCTFEGLIDNVINFIFYVSLALAPLMIIVAAVYLLASAGDPGKIRTAKDIILYTAIGFIIVLLAKGLIAMLKQILGG